MKIDVHQLLCHVWRPPFSTRKMKEVAGLWREMGMVCQEASDNHHRHTFYRVTCWPDKPQYTRMLRFLVHHGSRQRMPLVTLLPTMRWVSHLEKRDRFGSLVFDLTHEPTSNSEFTKQFQHYFIKRVAEVLRSGEAPAVWVQVPVAWSTLLPFLLQECGMRYHHAEGSKAMLVRWLAAGEDKTPIFGTHQVGVTALVTNDQDQTLLMVKERSKRYSGWKPPTGVADLSEDIGDAAVREVQEETGLQCLFHSVLAFRQQHDAFNAFGRSDLLFLCRLSPKDPSQKLQPCPEEINSCQWLTVVQFKELTAEKFRGHIPVYFQKIIDLAELGFRMGWKNVEHIPEKMSTVVDRHKTFYFYNSTKTIL